MQSPCHVCVFFPKHVGKLRKGVLKRAGTKFDILILCCFGQSEISTAHVALSEGCEVCGD